MSLRALAVACLAASLTGATFEPPPPTTAMGGLYHHVRRPREPKENYAPTNVNFGLLPPSNVRAKKRERKRLVAERAARDFAAWCSDSSAPRAA